MAEKGPDWLKLTVKFQEKYRGLVKKARQKIRREYDSETAWLIQKYKEIL